MNLKTTALVLWMSLGGIVLGDQAVSTNRADPYPITQKYKLATFSFQPAYYDEIIGGVFRKFLTGCSNSANCQEVTAKIADWTTEQKKVAAGQLKYRDKWYTSEQAADVALDVRAEQLLAAQEDNQLADAETAAFRKSGQFHVHAPGQPALADPPTYCFVGKFLKSGRPYLDITFICMDPHVDDLVLNEPAGTPQLTKDDSLEIFLDTDRSRSHYSQMIVNARGDWWAGEIQNHGDGKYEIDSTWDARPEIKVAVNKPAGRWVCEILIPFERLDNEPEKGKSWGVNFVRNYRGQGGVDDDTHLQTWFNVYDKTRNLHIPEQFGQLDW